MNYPNNITLGNTTFKNLYDSFMIANKAYRDELKVLKGLYDTKNNHIKAKEFIMEYGSQYDPFYLAEFYKQVEDYIKELPSTQKYMYCINDSVPIDESFHVVQRVNIYVKCNKDVDITQFEEYKTQAVKVEKLLEEVIALKGECESMLNKEKL